MALPGSGQLSLKDIGVELGITAGQQASLRSMSSTAGFSTPDAVSEFYGYSAGDNITVQWGTSYSPSPLTSTQIGLARVITLSGLSSATVQAYLTMTITSSSLISSCYVYWSTTSSTGPWTGPIISRTTPGSSSSYIPSGANYVSSAQTLYARQLITKSSKSGYINGSLNLSGSTYNVGSGTVSSWSGGSPLSWAISF